MSCVHGELKLELERVLGEDAAFALWVSCKSCAAKSLFRQKGSGGNSLPFNLTHAKWAKRAWRAGINLGDGTFDVRLHSIESEKDQPIRRIPFDRAVWFRVEPHIEGSINTDKPRILVDVTSWSCHHTAYLKVIPYPAHEYVVCTNCWTGCALPDANNVNAKSPVYVQRTNIVGAIWWEDSGRKSSVAIPIARLVRKAVKVSTWGWQIAEAAEGLPETSGVTCRGESTIIVAPELFKFGGRRFGKLS